MEPPYEVFDSNELIFRYLDEQKLLEQEKLLEQQKLLEQEKLLEQQKLLEDYKSFITYLNSLLLLKVKQTHNEFWNNKNKNISKLTFDIPRNKINIQQPISKDFSQKIQKYIGRNPDSIFITNTFLNIYDIQKVLIYQTDTQFKKPFSNLYDKNKNIFYIYVNFLINKMK